MLTTAGVHVPLTPLLEVVGRAGAVLSAQKGAMGVKIGVFT